MAGGQERALRGRIKSVQATRKITKAMELIAASQIPRSQARIAANRQYRDGMRRIIREAAEGDPAGAAKLLAQPEHVEAAAVIVIAGDRGLAGAYNSAALRAGERLVNEMRERGTNVRLFVAGKKAIGYYRFRGIEVEAGFTGFADRPTFADARSIAAVAAAPYIDGEVQQIILVSTHYRSAASQEVGVSQLLPLTPIEGEAEASTGLKGYTEFEPEVNQLLFFLAPRALESEIFTALLEGAASFFAAQQRAMAAATENADELAKTLTRVMNRARQDAITTEIMEIVGGAEALRSGK